MPNPATFPFTGVRFNVRGGDDIVFDADDMSAALQYSATSGVPVGTHALGSPPPPLCLPPTTISTRLMSLWLSPSKRARLGAHFFFSSPAHLYLALSSSPCLRRRHW